MASGRFSLAGIGGMLLDYINFLDNLDHLEAASTMGKVKPLDGRLRGCLVIDAREGGGLSKYNHFKRPAYDFLRASLDVERLGFKVAVYLLQPAEL
ncbi:hypothetical protein ACHAQJ_007948 [Trichoderma viride]